MKSLLGLFVYFFTFAVVVCVIGAWWFGQEFTKPGPLTETTLVEIPAGASLTQITEKLSETESIENPMVFQTATRVLGEQSNLKAGEYELEPGMSPRDIVSKLTAGKVHQRSFTIPEGLTSYEIINLINTVEDLKGEPITAIPAEGSLLPETYSYSQSDTKATMLTRISQAMSALSRPPPDGLCKTNIARKTNAPQGLAVPLPEVTKDTCWPDVLDNWEQVITLASIVEKETGVASERRRIAGVFLNRLRKNIPLQTDPTVIYALTKGKPKSNGKGPLDRRLLSKDLEIDSPYNTYKYPGLPPGPIANPGRAAIEAVLNPEEHDFYYFVADGAGGHVFSGTLEEHNKNVTKWRKIRRAQKD